MPDTWITDITHFVSPDGSLTHLPGPARKLAEYLLDIIARAEDIRGASFRPTNVRCRRRPAHRPCPGLIVACLPPGREEIHWECPECGDTGFIRNWQGLLNERSTAGNSPSVKDRGSRRPASRGGSSARVGHDESATPALERHGDRLDAIIELTDAVCASHLNGEYAVLARKLATTLARMDPSPLSRGRSDIWACGILYALGTVNFLFDTTQTLHLTAGSLCAACGVGASSAATKARTIRDMLEMYYLDPDWCIPSLIPENPLVWLFEIDGMIQDIRTLPRDLQAAAFLQGLIPYIPADRLEDGPRR